jgi:hypothetical protein
MFQPDVNRRVVWTSHNERTRALRTTSSPQLTVRIDESDGMALDAIRLRKPLCDGNSENVATNLSRM